jgi:hypothetical protein
MYLYVHRDCSSFKYNIDKTGITVERVLYNQWVQEF